MVRSLVGAGFAVALLASLPADAGADRPATGAERDAIAATVPVTAPNGTGAMSGDCIAPRVTTERGDYATVILTHSPDCVERYGGASGESQVVTMVEPGRWQPTGFSIGTERCPETALVPALVLDDLGCVIPVRSRLYRRCGDAGVPNTDNLAAVQARNISCRKARTVVSRWLRTFKPRSGPRGWTCQYREAVNFMRCQRATQRLWLEFPTFGE